MSILKKVLLSIFANAVALGIVVYLFDAITFSKEVVTTQDQLKVLIIAGLVIGIINTFVKPILKIVAFPLIVLTLGLFYLIINAVMLWLVTQIIPELMITSFAAYLLGALVFSIINTLAHYVFKQA